MTCLAGLVLLAGRLHAQEDGGEADRALTELEAAFRGAVQERTSTLDAQYVAALESLERELVGQQNYAGAALVVAEIEQITGSRVGREAEAPVETHEPEGGVLRLAAKDATLEQVSGGEEGLRGWTASSRARWSFPPLPQGGFRVVLCGRAAMAGELRVRVEDQSHFLDGARTVAEGETFEWELGYLRVDEASAALQLSAEAEDANLVIESVELFSPRTP